MSRPWTIGTRRPAGARERRDDPLGHAVAAVGRRPPSTTQSPSGVPSAHERMWSIGGVGRRRRRRRAARLDDRRAALGDRRDEGAVDPVVVADELVRRSCRRPRRGTGRGTASSSGCPRSSSSSRPSTGTPSFCGELADGAVVVEPGHRGEPPGVEVGGVALGDQRVGVGRVADDEDLDVALRARAEGLALRLEDAAVGRRAGRCAPCPPCAASPRRAARRRRHRTPRRRRRCTTTSVSSGKAQSSSSILHALERRRAPA